MSNLLEKASIVLTPTAYSDGTLHSVKPLKTLGSELVTNRAFDTDSDWTKGTGWTISGGTASCDGSQSSTSNFSQSNVISDQSRTYRVEFTLSNYAAGTIKSKISNNAQGGVRTANGTYVDILSGMSNTQLTFTANSDFVGSIDNVSVKEVIDADFDFTRGTAATRVNSQGLVEDVQILSDDLVQNGDFEQIGSELVTNGNFDTDSDWTKGSAWTIANGQASYDASGITPITSATTSIVSGKTYRLKFKITTSGFARLNFTNDSSQVLFEPNGNSVNNFDSGEYTFYLSAQNNSTALKIFAYNNSSGTSFSIDNVSVKEVGQNWTLGTGWSIEDGKAVSVNASNQSLSQSTSSVLLNKKYRISFDVEYISGSAKFQLVGGTTQDVVVITSSGSYVAEVVSNADKSSYRVKGLTTGSGFNGSIDNVSVIEITDDTDLPRINYLGGTGHILLEPQSINKYTYSEDFSQGVWDKTSATVSTSTITDPTGGQNSFKLVPDSGTGGNRSLSENFTSLSGLHTQSVFAKKGEYDYIMLRTRNAPSTGVMFNLENGTFNVNLTTAAFDSAKIEDYGDGWFRCSMTLDPSEMTTSGQIYTSFSVGITGSETNSFNGDGTSGIYIFGAQFEALSFPTSYIPTSGSTVTRSADAANNSGSSDLINSTEGVLYAEIAALADDLTFRGIALSDGTNDNRVLLRYRTTSNQINLFIRANSTTIVNTTKALTDITNFSKFAIKYKSGDIALWVDGQEAKTDTNTFTLIGLDTLNFDAGNGSDDFYGKVKSIAVFKEALTDAQLASLTGTEYNSFAALAAAFNYTVI